MVNYVFRLLRCQSSVKRDQCNNSRECIAFVGRDGQSIFTTMVDFCEYPVGRWPAMKGTAVEADVGGQVVSGPT